MEDLSSKKPKKRVSEGWQYKIGSKFPFQYQQTEEIILSSKSVRNRKISFGEYELDSVSSSEQEKEVKKSPEKKRGKSMGGNRKRGSSHFNLIKLQQDIKSSQVIEVELL